MRLTNPSNTFCGTLLVMLLTMGHVETTAGQAVSELPRAEYYVAKELYGSGRTLDALEGFRVALSRSRRVGDARWVDSIPPLVMLGECYYQQGSLAMAMEQYDAALMLTLGNQGWINQIEVGTEQLPLLEGVAKGIDWFSKTRQSRPVAIPGAVQITVDLGQAQPAPGGGVVAPVGLLTRLDATEVVRTLGIAMLRRWQILGPLAAKSPLSEPMVQYFGNAPNQPAAWLQASWSVLRGIAELSAANNAAAAGSIRNGVLLGDRFDYFMSSSALLALAEIEARKGNFQAAIPMLQDASLMAAEYEQHDELATSLGRLGEYASASNRVELLAPLQRAATWSSKQSSMSFAACTIATAELAIYANNLALAERLTKQAIASLRNREISIPRLQAKLAFVRSSLAFAQDKGAIGVTQLDNALKLMRGTAQSGAVVEDVFRAQMVLNLLANNNLTSGDAEDLLSEILREPGEVDWQLSPLKTLASMTTASVPAYERFLELAATRGDENAILMRVDRLQRQRFYESLPLGGRLFSWRYAVASDPAVLPPAARQAVAQARINFPALTTRQDRIKKLLADIKAGPMPLDERQLPPATKKLYTELRTQSTSHENQLAFQALARRALPRIVPRPPQIEQFKDLLAKDDAMISFAVTGNAIFGIAITKDQILHWQVGELSTVEEVLSQLFQNIGLKKSPRIAPSEVTKPSAVWRNLATTLRDKLLPAAAQQLMADSNRVIIVPNARLWYVPFELLPDPNTGDPWITRRTVTYVPTLGSINAAFHTALGNQASTLSLVGSLFSPDTETNQELADSIARNIPRSSSIALSQKITAGSGDWLRLKTDRLWTSARIPTNTSGWDTLLMPLGRSKQSLLGSWLQTPMASPRNVVLPGYSSGAAGPDGNGNELFLAACGMLFSGTQSAVISRWPVGGRSTASILLRYLEEAPSESSSVALRRAILSQWPEDYLIADEPGLLPAGDESDALTTGRHPLLWAGYMSIGDTRK